MKIRLVIFNEYYRINVVGDREFRPHLLPDLGLKGGELEFHFRVIPNNEIDRTVAEIAYTVKQYDRAHNKNSTAIFG